MILLINKDNLFNESMIMDFEMVEYENFKEDIFYIEKETFRHFEMLRAYLRVENIDIEIVSAYRSLETQENVFLQAMQKYGIDYAEQVVDMPGTSDHHSGQALDIIICVDGEWIENDKDFDKYEEIFARLHGVIKYFGFILRYPKGKEMITGHLYNPGHIRYVGESCAKLIGDLTLEEYLNNEKY